MTELTPQEINAQIKATVAKSKRQASQIKQPDVNPYEVRKNIATCLEAVMGINGMFKQIGMLRVWFDDDYLAKEGNTDMSKVDKTYMLTLGRQLIEDTKSLGAEYNELSAEANKMAKRGENALNSGNITAITNIGVDSIDIQTQAADFVARLNTVCINAANDIVAHLNLARDADHQVRLINPEK